MDRITWLRDMQRECEAQYDHLWAPLYAEGKVGVYDNTTHLQFIEALLNLLAPGSRVLDAACGTGRYLPYLLEKGHTVLAIDQSQGMLACAREIYPQVRYEKVDLQGMAYRAVFDGAICMDAMENVPPEDWPVVLGNLHRALRPGGYLYFTAETLENTEAGEVQQAYERAVQAGLPVVFGEWPDEQVYHYHPTNAQVREWTRQAGFAILREADSDTWYFHVLAQR